MIRNYHNAKGSWRGQIFAKWQVFGESWLDLETGTSLLQSRRLSVCQVPSKDRRSGWPWYDCVDSLRRLEPALRWVGQDDQRRVETTCREWSCEERNSSRKIGKCWFVVLLLTSLYRPLLSRQCLGNDACLKTFFPAGLLASTEEKKLPPCYRLYHRYQEWFKAFLVPADSGCPWKLSTKPIGLMCLKVAYIFLCTW